LHVAQHTIKSFQHRVKVPARGAFGSISWFSIENSRQLSGFKTPIVAAEVQLIHSGALLALKLLDDFMAPELALKGSRGA